MVHVVPKTYHQSFVKDNAVVISGHILGYLKGIILMSIIIKTVGVTIYGGFVLLTSFFGIAYGISSFGAGFRAKRFMPSVKSMTERGSLFYPQFLFNMLSILSFSMVFILLENQLNVAILKNEITYSIWITPLYLITYLLYAQGTDYFRYTSRIQYMTLATLCFPYLHIGFVLLCYYEFGSISINMLMITTAISCLLVAIPIYWVIFREIGTNVTFYKATALIRDIKMGFPLVLGFIVDIILAASDRYVIAFYLTLSDVGNYTIGYALGSLIVLIPKAMYSVLPQLLCRAVDNGNEPDAHKMVNYALNIFLLIAIPFIFGSLALSKPILTLFSNADVAQNVFLVMPVVALGSVFFGLNIILSSVMFVRLKTNAIFKMNAIAAFFNLMANMILFYYFKSIIVAAITTILSYVIAFLYSYRIVIKEWPVEFFIITIGKSIIASVTMYIVLLFLSAYNHGYNSLITVGSGIILGISIYILLLFLLNAFSSKEINYLKSIFVIDHRV